MSKLIVWVDLAAGENPESVVDRRGGVDILLGGLGSSFDRLARAGRLMRLHPAPFCQWMAVSRSRVGMAVTGNDSRADPDSRLLARIRLEADGWAQGYEGLVRAAGEGRSFGGSASVDREECLAIVRGGGNPSRALEFVQSLQNQGLARPLSSAAVEGARADDLLADLLQATLVDALDELREAVAALEKFGHPARAEGSIGERPPWPPASVARLRADPNGEAMVETLLGQIAPDPEARAWLVASWSYPKRPIDGTLLGEIASAADGRLVLEPRFRAWLRGEWTAWTRQLDRRVARLAGGYNPP